MDEQPQLTPPVPAPMQDDPVAIQIALLKKIETHLSTIRTVLAIGVGLVILSVLISACQVVLAAFSSLFNP